MNPATYNITVKNGIHFGPLKITCKKRDNTVVNLTGWIAFAHAKIAPNRNIQIDLAPAILNPTGGEITIDFNQTVTDGMLPGDYLWDLILQDPNGRRWGPYLAGKFKVMPVITKP